jgi:hypothetical protein
MSIYLSELEIKDTTEYSTSASYFDVLLKLAQLLSTSKYEYDLNCEEKSKFYKFISKGRNISPIALSYDRFG